MNRIILITVLTLGLLIYGVGCKEGIEDRHQPQSNEESKVEVIVGGDGSNIPLIRKMAEVYMQNNPEVIIKVLESVGSAGGITNTQRGLFDLGLVSRPLTKEEKNSLQITYKPYAKTITIFAAHPSVGVTNLTEEQVRQIYSGEISNWKEVGGEDRPITVLDRHEDDFSRLVFNFLIPGFRDYNGGGNTVVLATEQAMNEGISSVEYSIGWTDLGAVKIDQLKIKIININGVVPGYLSVKEGKYKLVKELAFVWRPEVSKQALDFIKFVDSDEGRQLMLTYGYIPVLEVPGVEN